jgi:serine/threonine-protein kinase
MRDAEATYQAAIRVRPNYWEGYNALGVFYFTQGQYSQAAEMFTHVTNLASDSYRGYSNLGAAYLQVGRNADAVRALKRSIEIRPSYEGFSNLATAYFRLRQYNDAAHNYSQALSLNDRDYLVWGNLATAYYYSVDNRSKAQSAYEKAVSGAKSALVVNPRDASVHADLAEYYSMLGDREEALSQLAEALNMSSQPNPGLLFRAAMVHNQLGDTELALGFLSKAVKDGYSITNINEAPALDNLRSKKELQAILEENKDTHGQR